VRLALGVPTRADAKESEAAVSAPQRLRRVIVIRPQLAEQAARAARYCAENSDMGGDHTKEDGVKFTASNEMILAGQARDVAADARALDTAIDAIMQHCSCVHEPHKLVRHAEGCFVRLHDKDLRRLTSLRALLQDAP
jgi:hypothetical protein